MISATRTEVRNALRAFVGSPMSGDGIGSTKLPAKAAYRVGRLVAKLRSLTVEVEEKQRALFRDAGGVMSNGELVVALQPRWQNETDEEFRRREESHQARLRDLNEKVEAMMSELVEVDYDPIPIELFGDAALSAVECSLAEKFLKE